MVCPDCVRWQKETVRWQRIYVDDTNRLTRMLLDRTEREQRDGALAMLRGLVGTCDEGTFDEVTRALWEAKRFIAMADNNWFELPKRVEGEVVQFKRRDA